MSSVTINQSPSAEEALQFKQEIFSIINQLPDTKKAIEKVQKIKSQHDMEVAQGMLNNIISSIELKCDEIKQKIEITTQQFKVKIYEKLLVEFKSKAEQIQQALEKLLKLERDKKPPKITMDVVLDFKDKLEMALHSASKSAYDNPQHHADKRKIALALEIINDLIEEAVEEPTEQRMRGVLMHANNFIGGRDVIDEALIREMVFRF